MKTILVTGGAGFIGSHTCVELLNSNYNVIILDDFSNSSPASVNNIKLITGKEPLLYANNLLDFSNTCRIFEENNIDAVIHFAGFKAVGESVEKPLDYYYNNIVGTLTLLKVMREYHCKKIVFSSSATVYGMNNPVPYQEDYPTSATNPYGYTKVMIEQMLFDICKANNDWCSLLLRYFNPIGAHKSGFLGENPNGTPNNLMPYISQVATGKLKQLNIYGNNYATTDGTGVRDYIHVVDLALGHIAALEYAFKSSGAHAINLGTGTGSSVLQVVAAFEKAAEIVINKTFAPRREGDIAECYANTTKAKLILNWETKFNLDDMCADSWHFAKKNSDKIQ